MLYRFALLPCLSILSLLSGCAYWSSETQPVFPEQTSIESQAASKRVPLLFDRFSYEYYGPTGTAVTSATAYNFKTNSTAYGTGVTTTYGWQSSGAVHSRLVNDLENAGYNVKHPKPQIRLIGAAFGTGIDFSHFWSDFGINFLGAITLGSIGSTRYTGEATLSVYLPDGRRIGYYHENTSWNYKVAGSPFVTVLYNSQGSAVEANAVLYASISCVARFLYDLKTGRYDEYLPDEYKVLKNAEKMEQEKAKDAKETSSM